MSGRPEVSRATGDSTAGVAHCADRTVPLPVLSLAKLDSKSRDAIIAGGCVTVGNQVEVDLLAADAAAPGSAAVLAEYWTRTRVMLDDLAAGVDRPDARLTRRTVVSARQIDTKAERRDLGEELAVLTGHPLLTRAAGILETKPDWKMVGKAGTVTRSASTSTVTVAVRGQGLPEPLGGARGRNEIVRHVSIEASHAAWRDRKARRLVSVAVTVDEVWPAR